MVGVGAARAAAAPAYAGAPATKVDLGKSYLDCWQAFNDGAWDKFTACYSDKAKSHLVDSGMPDLVGPKDIVEKNAKLYKAAFPDMKGTVQLVLVSGHNFYAVAHVTGTNTGPLVTPAGTVPATKKKVGYLLFHGGTFGDDGKVTEEWFIYDMNTMMAQLGLSPAPARPVMEKAPMAKAEIVVASDSATEKANAAAAAKEIEGFNKHDVAAAMGTAGDDVMEADQAAPADKKGKKDVTEGLKMFMGAWSDAKLTPAMSAAAGDYTVTVGRFTGTNDGDMGPMKKTGKKVDVGYAEITKVEKGKTKVYWRFYNGMAFAVQLGMVPAPKK
jgi:predicted ester cyclase